MKPILIPLCLFFGHQFDEGGDYSACWRCGKVVKNFEWSFKKIWKLLGETDKWKNPDYDGFNKIIHENGVYFYADLMGVRFRKKGGVVYEPIFWTWLLIRWKVKKLLKNLERIENEKTTKTNA